MDRTSLFGLHAYVSAPWLDRCALVQLRISTWLEACADYHAASVHYEEMRRLSDAELRRRGLDRKTLARNICAACDRRDQMR